MTITIRKSYALGANPGGDSRLALRPIARGSAYV